MLAVLAGCSNSRFETPQLQGAAALVNDAGTPRLWVLSKQEEVRKVGVGAGTTRLPSRERTYFHFEVQAFDPVAARPVWKQRLRTFGDPASQGMQATLVVGSTVGARLLGQDGDLVWLLIGEEPYALRAADGSIAADAEVLQQINPSLERRLPSEARFYGFDRGLVITAADARQLVIRGNEHRAEPYTPPLPRAEPEGPLKANGTRELVPTAPDGDAPVRHVTLGGKRLFMFTDKEAADAMHDPWGRKLRWPYTVLNEGKLARRTLMNATIDTVQRFADRFERIASFTPIADAPTFLNGRLAKDPATGNARVVDGPEGVLVWYSTRIDDAGRVGLARLDAELNTLWQTELPLSESGMSRRLATWWLSTHLVVVGNQRAEEDGATVQIPYLVSIDLASGSMQSTPLIDIP